MSDIEKYTPPTSITEVYNNIKIAEEIDANDPRYVATWEGRGNFSFSELLKHLNVNDNKTKFIDNSPFKRNYIAFCGHRGCGKTTELKRLASDLDKDNLFLVVFLEASKELDSNNIQYTDVLMAITKLLFERLQNEKLIIEQEYLKNLESWFEKMSIIVGKNNDYSTEIKNGFKLGINIPSIVSVFSSITASFKTNATYREELRKDIKNTFSDFAFSFNILLNAVRDKISEINRKEILFIVDDLEKLPLEYAKGIFIDNINQLKQIQSNFIYSAPIAFLYENNRIQDNFETVTLPMIKIYEKDGKKNEKGFEVLRNMLLKRADIKLFENPELIDKLIEYSGGNPSHLFKLLSRAYFNSQNDYFDGNAIEKAIYDLATDFERFLNSDDYKILFKVDNKDCSVPDENIKKLLYNLALLEYNHFWWKSHPAIRLLSEYKKHATFSFRRIQ